MSLHVVPLGNMPVCHTSIAAQLSGTPRLKQDKVQFLFLVLIVIVAEQNSRSTAAHAAWLDVWVVCTDAIAAMVLRCCAWCL